MLITTNETTVVDTVSNAEIAVIGETPSPETPNWYLGNKKVKTE